MDHNLTSGSAGQSPLEAQVTDLTIRLGRAEEMIGYLLRTVGQLQAERNLPSPTQPPPQYNIVDQNHTVFHHLKESENQAVRNDSNKLVNPSDMTSTASPLLGAAALPTQSATTADSPHQQIWDDMELDWDELGLLDEVDPATLQTGTEAESSAAVDGPKSTQKHPRDDEASIPDFGGAGTIKVMRYDSLDRIQRYTVQASAVSDKNLIKIDANINYDEERKTLGAKILRSMNVGDMNGLSKLVSEHFCDSMVMHYCQVPDTIYGKAEAMMMLSLIYESYPDGVWKVTSTEVQGKVVVFQYLFSGTSVFDTPLAESFHQVKEHQRSASGLLSENSEEMATRQIARHVAEYNPRRHSAPSRSSSITGAGGLTGVAGLSGVAGAGSGAGSGAIDLAHLTMYDRLQSPHSSDAIDAASDHSAAAATGTAASGPASVTASESDVINIPRSKGNESFRLDGRAPSFSLTADRKPDFKHSFSLQPLHPMHPHHQTTTPTSELLANSLLTRKTYVMDRRRMEVTFNDYNLVVQLVISSVGK